MSVPATFPAIASTVETGPLRFADAPAAWVTALLVLGVVWFSVAVYRRERGNLTTGRRFALGSLRVSAFLLLLATLFRPYREEVRKTEEKGHLVVLVDTSASMTTADRYPADSERRLVDAAGPAPLRPETSRLEWVQRVVSEPVLARLSERFVLHAFAFDEDVRSLGLVEDGAVRPDAEPAEGDANLPVAARIAKALGRVRAAGGRTEIGAALKSVWRDFVGRDDRRLAGVLLLSDGRDNSEGQTPVETVAALGRSAEDLHLTAVALGDPRLARNLRVDSVSAKDVVLVQDEVAFRATLKHTGFSNVDGVEVRIEIEQVADPDGKSLPSPRRVEPARSEFNRTSVRVRLGPEDKAVPAALRARFDEAGTFDVRVRAVLPGDLAREDAIREDDSRVHRLRVVNQTIRVLMVDGRLRHDSWFLKNLLVRESRHVGDPKRVDAQCWIQSFDREVEQPHGRSVPPLRHFPSTRQELFSFDVVLFGDVDWRTLAPTEDQSRRVLALVREFVAEGGGIAFCAGVDRNPDQYVETPLQDLLPVTVGASDRANEPPTTRPFRLAPTEVGLSHPILAVVPDATPDVVERIWRERDGWDWYWMYRATGGLRPGATALARVANVSGPEWRDERQEPLVVFAVQPFGKGRVFYSAVDQIYRIRREHGDSYFGTFWDETIRWLATYRLLGGNKRLKVQTDKDRYYVGETAVITVSALDPDYQPLAGTTLSGLQVEDADGRALLGPTDVAKADPEAGPGVFRAQVRLPRSGAYRVYVDPPTRDGGARAEKRIEAAFATKEDQDTIPDHETLERLVRVANPSAQPGRVVPLWEVPALAESLPARTTERVLDRTEIQVWDGPWTLLLAVLLLGLEWGLRKRWRLI